MPAAVTDPPLAHTCRPSAVQQEAAAQLALGPARPSMRRFRTPPACGADGIFLKFSSSTSLARPGRPAPPGKPSRSGGPLQIGPLPPPCRRDFRRAAGMSSVGPVPPAAGVPPGRASDARCRPPHPSHSAQRPGSPVERRYNGQSIRSRAARRGPAAQRLSRLVKVIHY